jgi:hypothetical protein
MRAGGGGLAAVLHEWKVAAAAAHLLLEAKLRALRMRVTVQPHAGDEFLRR